MDFKRIKQAVINNTGGFEQASEQDIRKYWSNLPEETQDRYLKTVDDKPKPVNKTRDEMKNVSN